MGLPGEPYVKADPLFEKEEEIIGAVGIEDSIYDDEVEDLEEAAKEKAALQVLKEMLIDKIKKKADIIFPVV